MFSIIKVVALEEMAFKWTNEELWALIPSQKTKSIQNGQSLSSDNVVYIIFKQHARFALTG